MAGEPKLTLHVIPHSHPCTAVMAALEHAGLDYSTEELVSGRHAEEIERLYGPGKCTVPGLLVDERPVHGTAAIFAAIDDLAELDLYPMGLAELVREAEAGVADQLQTAGRHLVWGALHFRPDALGTFAGAGLLDPAGVDYSIKLLRNVWRYIGITAVGLAEQLADLPALLDTADELVAAGALAGEKPTAIDFQIGSTLQLLLKIEDLRPLIESRPAARTVTAWFDRPSPGHVPAGALLPGWLPGADASGAGRGESAEAQPS